MHSSSCLRVELSVLLLRSTLQKFVMLPHSEKVMGSIPGWGRAFPCGFYPCFPEFSPVSQTCMSGKFSCQGLFLPNQLWRLNWFDPGFLKSQANTNRHLLHKFWAKLLIKTSVLTEGSAHLTTTCRSWRAHLSSQGKPALVLVRNQLFRLWTSSLVGLKCFLWGIISCTNWKEKESVPC